MIGQFVSAMMAGKWQKIPDPQCTTVCTNRAYVFTLAIEAHNSAYISNLWDQKFYLMWL